MMRALLDMASDLLEAEARKIAEGPVRLLSFNFDLIREAARDDVIGMAEITRATRAAIFVSGRLTQGDEILATTTALFAIPPQ